NFIGCEHVQAPSGATCDGLRNINQLLTDVTHAEGKRRCRSCQGKKPDHGLTQIFTDYFLGS
ncbi:MAG: hypothetical protein AAB393_05155, partial [Bacteroidota bacterium]